MAIRLGEMLVYGELRNVRPWATHGYLLLDGAECPVAVELTGDCGPDLHGKVFRFAPRSGGTMKEVLGSIVWADRPGPGDPNALPFGDDGPAAEPESGEEAIASGDAPRADDATESGGRTPFAGDAPCADNTAERGGNIPIAGDSVGSDGDASCVGDTAGSGGDASLGEVGAHLPDDDMFSGPRLPPGLPKKFGFHQIGVTGDMTVRWVRSLPCPVKEYLKRCELGEKPPTQWKPSLYLEWYSQNGRVAIELEDPILEYEAAEGRWAPLLPSEPKPARDPDAPPTNADGEEMPALPDVLVVEDGQVRRMDPEEILDAARSDPDAAQDPGASLQRHLDAQNAALERSLRDAADANADDDNDDDDFMAETELLDDLMDHGTAVTPASLFSDRRTLPRPEDVTEEQATLLLKTLLMELALNGIAFHACDHSTARQLYRILVNEILFEGDVYRELRGTGWVTNYLAAEHCPECDAEADREFEARPDLGPGKRD